MPPAPDFPPVSTAAFEPLDRGRLASMLTSAAEARVAVLGDYCLDIYWLTDGSRSETSLETRLMTRPVREQRYALGGAGNVVNNLVTLGCRKVRAIGVVGDDPWGREMKRQLQDLDVDTTGLLVPSGAWATLAYTKPHIEGKESNRLDFGNFNEMSDPIADGLAEQVRLCIPEVDIVIVNQQVRQGVHGKRFREALVRIIAAHPERIFLADSRHFSEAFTGAWRKINDYEAARLCGLPVSPGSVVCRTEALAAAEALFARFARPVFVTRGRRGMMVRDPGGTVEIPAIQVREPIDTVGAGDSALAGISLGLVAGATPAEAAQLGNFAAAVTVRKLNQTGTASPAEIMTVGRHQGNLRDPSASHAARRPGEAWDPAPCDP